MKTLSSIGRACAAWMALSLVACATPPAAPDAAAPLRVRLMAFNDFHGQLESTHLSLSWPDPAQPGRHLQVAAGGAAALAGLVSALRAQVPHSVLISSGDQIGAAPMISTLLRHESTLDVLNRIGLDIATVGNHEFDAGWPEWQRLLRGGCAPAHPTLESCALGPHEGARFSVTAANVRGPGGAPVLAPFVVRVLDGVPIGFIGAVTRETPRLVTPSGVADLDFEDEAEAINRAARTLQAQGVQAIIAVIHEGGEVGPPGHHMAHWNDTTCPDARGAIFDLVPRLDPAVDVVLSAHTHQGYRCVVDGRLVMQSSAYGRGLAVLDLVVDRRSGDIDRHASTSHNLPVFNERSAAPAREALLASIPEPWQEALRRSTPDAAVAHRVAQYAAHIAPRMQVELGTIQHPFPRTGRTDSAAGRLIADAQLAATQAPADGGAQVALMNPGGIRTDLPCPDSPQRCAITRGQVLAMQPFGNALVVMTLTGHTLRAVLESQHRDGRPPVFLAPSRGLTYRWNAQAAPGSRVQDLRLHGQPVRDAQTLRVTVNSFLADGGDGFTLLRQGRERVIGLQDADALARYLAQSPLRDDTPRIVWPD